ncbi:adenine phosphoribosyltransferase [Aliagarivorans taiwanensis]|uniref:adenine phosphoribosyltransferase n=1 Tax=Aliagarivorans taiwanensis TaxID=561966 RepID=UPI00041255E6|nr:adenine phosphoribosyltransferase [Aliagarivorans taiwanensis]
MSSDSLDYIAKSIKAIPDYPKPGIMFRDITSLIEDPKAFALVISQWEEHYRNAGITKIVGTEARGFIFGAPLALALGIGFVPVRKPGKLPRQTLAESYELEYGMDTLEIHQDALTSDDKVLLIDDLIATGGTAEATVKLVRRLGATIEDAAFVINLVDLPGEAKLRSLDVNPTHLVAFEGE